MKILVIDDLEINRHSAKDLEEDGHEVIVVGTARREGRSSGHGADGSLDAVP